MSLLRNFFIIILFGFLTFFGISEVSAATLQLSPNAGTYSQGQTFTVSVFTSSADQSMNAASGNISFPPDKLEVVGLSKSGSIFNLWVQEPSFSNSAGTINFEGIVLNPGFTGVSGKILSVTFRAKSPGVAPVRFSTGAVLANDGLGTNIVTALGTASYGVNKVETRKAPAVITSPSVIAGTPLAPQITSLTHPDPNAWYADNNPGFSWQIPSDVTGVSIGISADPTGDPGPVSDGIISQKSFTDLEDGVWYFHVKLQNSNGWGAISHYRVQIDTSPPSIFIINQLPREDKTDPNVKLEFVVADKTSEVSDFDIVINGDVVNTWNVEGQDFTTSEASDARSYIYKTPLLGIGENALIITARDQAGNGSQKRLNIFVEPLPLPKVINYSDRIDTNNFFGVQGEAQPNSNVIVKLSSIDGYEEIFSSRATEEGKFTVVSNDNHLKQGQYEFVLYIENDRGARSDFTEKYTLLVEPSSLQAFGNRLITILTVIIPILALLVVLSLLVWYAWFKFISLKKKLTEEVEETEHNVTEAIEKMRLGLQKNINSLKKVENKQPLSNKEKAFINNIKKGVDDVAYDIEKYVSAEIEDLGQLADLGKNDKNIEKIKKSNKQSEYLKQYNKLKNKIKKMFNFFKKKS